MNTKLRLLKYILPHWKRILSGIFFTFLMGLSDALLAPAAGFFIEGFSDISSAIQQGKEIFIDIQYNFFGEIDFRIYKVGVEECTEALYYFIIGLIVLVIFKGVFVFGKELLMNSVVQKILMGFRNDLYTHIVHLPMRFFDTQKTGEIMSRVTNDVNMINSSMNAFVVILQSFIYTIIFVTGMLLIDWQLTLLFLIIFPLLGITIKYFSSKIRDVSRRIAMKIADISSFLQETISSIKIVKSYTREDFEKKRMHEKTKENYRFSLRSVFLVALLKPANEIISVGGMVIIFMICGLKLINGDLLIGDLTMFIGFLAMSYKPIKTLGEVTEALERATASAERIFEVIDTQGEPLKVVANPKKLGRINGDVVFENVKFSYSEENIVLTDINIKAKQGETVALVGPSGSGKSTIVSLIMRFYDVQSGRILVDGEDISEVEIKSLRSQISLVPQETILFSGNVLENIRYGRLDATDEEIIEAAKKANADIFIQNLPKKYNTEIGERGMQLSGGQRQRIAIARAMLKNPRILLLDEATSALDTESETLVKEALDNLMKGRTTFVIAHRLSTILNANVIHVVENGRIVQSGSHDELLQQKGLYYKLYTMQFGETFYE